MNKIAFNNMQIKKMESKNLPVFPNQNRKLTLQACHKLAAGMCCNTGW
jgi:hypothetical protein